MSEREPKTSVRLGANYWRLWVASAISNLGDGVSLIAYPWLASAVTRNPVLLALVAVVRVLPWLFFTLPAGVITDRVDRRRLIIVMDAVRFVITGAVAFFILAGPGTLPSPEEVESGVFETGSAAYLIVLYVSALLFGLAEVLRDNAAQTILPAIVEPEALEKANGNLWGAEMVANSLIGPPIGGFLLGVAFAVPFFFDAGSFALAAGLVLLVAGEFRAPRTEHTERIEWKREIGEGVRWLWHHPLLRPMAIILGLMNGLFTMAVATYVLFVQEILGLGAGGFGALMTAGAIGGVLGSALAARVSRALGSGLALYMAILGFMLTQAITGATSSWVVVWVMFVVGSFLAVLWNVITVSLRQTIIPDELLGRVNSVYRFVGWGMMPLGGLAGGVLVALTEIVGGRDLALRMPFFVSAAAYLLLFVYALPRLTTEKIEAARAAGLQQREAASADRATDAAVTMPDSLPTEESPSGED